MAQLVRITFEGIMILSFDQAKTKCVIGVPPTDGEHEFIRTVNGVKYPIGKLSSIRVVDFLGNPISPNVTREEDFFRGSDDGKVIDFRSADFHPGAGFNMPPYKHRHRLEIYNGCFIASDMVRNALFKRDSSASSTPDLTRGVARSATLLISIDELQQQRVIFEDSTWGSVILNPGQQIRITNICAKCDKNDPDFRFYYNALNVIIDQQRVPIPPFPHLLASDQNGPIKDSPDLPCWIGGYDEPPDQPNVG